MNIRQQHEVDAATLSELMHGQAVSIPLGQRNGVDAVQAPPPCSSAEPQEINPVPRPVTETGARVREAPKSGIRTNCEIGKKLLEGQNRLRCEAAAKLFGEHRVPSDAGLDHALIQLMAEYEKVAALLPPEEITRLERSGLSWENVREILDYADMGNDREYRLTDALQHVAPDDNPTARKVFSTWLQREKDKPRIARAKYGFAFIMKGSEVVCKFMEMDQVGEAAKEGMITTLPLPETGDVSRIVINPDWFTKGEAQGAKQPQPAQEDQPKG